MNQINYVPGYKCVVKHRGRLVGGGVGCHIKENISYLRRTDLDWMSQDWTDVFRSNKAPKQSYFVDIDPSSHATLQLSLIYYNKILMMYFLSQITLLFLVTLIVIWWPLSVMRPIVYNDRHIIIPCTQNLRQIPFPKTEYKKMILFIHRKLPLSVQNCKSQFQETM